FAFGIVDRLADVGDEHGPGQDMISQDAGDLRTLIGVARIVERAGWKFAERRIIRNEDRVWAWAGQRLVDSGGFGGGHELAVLREPGGDGLGARKLGGGRSLARVVRGCVICSLAS